MGRAILRRPALAPAPAPAPAPVVVAMDANSFASEAHAISSWACSFAVTPMVPAAIIMSIQNGNTVYTVHAPTSVNQARVVRVGRRERRNSNMNNKKNKVRARPHVDNRRNTGVTAGDCR